MKKFVGYTELLLVIVLCSIDDFYGLAGFLCYLGLVVAFIANSLVFTKFYDSEEEEY